MMVRDPQMVKDFEDGIFTMLAADMTTFKTIDAWEVSDPKTGKNGLLIPSNRQMPFLPQTQGRAML